MPPKRTTIRGVPIQGPTPAQQARASAPFHPPNDTSTYKDLLLFEERLKMNAQMLRRRKRRYEVFLFTLVASIIFLAHRTVFERAEPPLVRYTTQGLLAVALVTLVLFFASGMYQERIRYANKYVPHANRTLRSINMHLNMRRPPRTVQSFLHFIPWLPRSSSAAFAVNATRKSSEKDKTPTTSSETATARKDSLSSSAASSQSASTNSAPSVIPPIPPTNNPRGELIFSSKVDKAFREGYERYRAAFERRREEKMREQHARNSWLRWVWGGGGGAGSVGLSGGATGVRTPTLPSHGLRRVPGRSTLSSTNDASITPLNLSRSSTPTLASAPTMGSNALDGPSRRLRSSARRPMHHQSSAESVGTTDSDTSSIQDVPAVAASSSSTDASGQGQPPSPLRRGHEKTESYSFILGRETGAQVSPDRHAPSDTSSGARRSLAGIRWGLGGGNEDRGEVETIAEERT